MAKKILIVDDSSMIRLIVSKAAKKAGYEVVSAVDGKDGLEQLALHDNIDLVLSDINMPIMGGFEMIDSIKNDAKRKYLPIVMLTTESSDELKQKGRDCGVKAWMVKPFNEKTFLKAMMKIIGE